jgi:glutathione synthase/RimK-type ligase-like ATP-grasp enzyme
VLNQRELLASTIETSWEHGRARATIDYGHTQLSLDAVSGVYTRLTSFGVLPEVVAEPALWHNAQRLHQALEMWLETTHACIINRTSANDTNNSKPYQALIIRDYFDVPATLVTNVAAEVLDFRSEFGEIIYKSSSGERSIVTKLCDADVARLDHLATVPVQFQEFVQGRDVRVHVVGSEVFASVITSDAVDYRYDHSGQVDMRPMAVSSELGERCVALTARLGLTLAGIDLRYAADGRVVCFEVNPSPAFSVFDDLQAGAPIADAIARHLLGH